MLPLFVVPKSLLNVIIPLLNTPLNFAVVAFQCCVRKLDLLLDENFRFEEQSVQKSINDLVLSERYIGSDRILTSALGLSCATL